MYFDKILIANRGEIACRIIATAKRLNIQTVAIYSDIDANAKHVALADEAYCIGPAPSQQSYLRGDAIIAIAKKSGAQAIHPGYGFLAENAAFSKACSDNNVIFIGPSADSISAMGSKTAAKILMKQHQVPTTPGYEGDQQDCEFLIQQAQAVGLPILFKASAGGGGKGMRLVTKKDQLQDAINSAKREALSSFGDDELLIEKYLPDARHVEVQIFCDQQGNGVYLYDRDCSVQRRHQKIIEEAPAPNIDQSTKERMGEVALQAAKAINYYGAGTIEFLYNSANEFYFMEMNTRLQVEHPVTEMITGIDLVEWQLMIAAGKKIPLNQDQVVIQGHAFEARLCAEDPYDQFKPSCGQIDILSFPHESEHIRIDSGIRAGDQISPYYDPMIAKVIVWDNDRASALNQLHEALSQSVLLGVSSNIDLLNAITQEPDFKSAKLSTCYLDNHAELLQPITSINNEQLALASMGYQFLSQQQPRRQPSLDSQSPWHQRDYWRISPQQHGVYFWFMDQSYNTRMQNGAKTHHYSLNFTDNSSIDAELSWHEQSWFTIQLNGITHRVRMILHDHQLILFHQNRNIKLLTHPPGSGDTQGGSSSALDAPMPGTVIDVLVQVGDSVNAGDKLLVMEAMKMESSISAPYKGTVTAIHFDKGTSFSEGDTLLDVTA